MAPATDQLTAPPAAPSLPPGYDSNTGTVPAESTGIAPAPKPTAPLAATSAAPSLGEKLTSLKSQVWKSITSNTNDQKAEQAWAKHAAQTDAENAAHEKMYQDDPETFKKQYPFEWLHRKVYDTVKNAVEAEPEETAASLGPKAKQNIDALVQTGLQQIGVTPPSQKTTMEGVALPIGGPIGEIEPSMEVLGPSARRVANAPQLPEHAAEPIDVQGHVLDEHGNPTASTVPAGKLDDLGTRLPDLQTADLAERRDVRSRLFPSGNQTRIGQTANRTFDVIRQNEAEANAPTIEHREVSTYGSGSEAPQPMQQVRLQQNGKTIGRVNYVIDPDTNIASVKAQGIDDPNLRGKGYGQQMVLAAADQARARGATALTSDLQGTTSMDAARVWDKLAAKGHPVEKIPSKAGSPGYTMDLTKPSPLPQYGQALSERGELPGQTVQLGDLGAKYVGKAPSQITTSEIEPKAASYHPDLQKMADKYGVVPSPSGGTEASFITPDGKFIRLPAGGTHDTAIDFVTGRQAGPEGDNRIGFLNDTGAIRLRVSNDKAGKTEAAPEVTPQQQVIAEMSKLGDPDKAQMQLAERAGRVRIKALETAPGARQQGHAAALLSKLTDSADKHGVTLELTASPYAPVGFTDKILDSDELQAFYKRHGFVMEPGHDPAYGYMIREPKSPETAPEVNPHDLVERAQQALAAGDKKTQKAIPTSKEFQEWFGNSKMVDKNGHPLVAYHGTTSPVDFEDFSTEGPPRDEEGNESVSSSGDPNAYMGAHFAIGDRAQDVANKFAENKEGWLRDRYTGENEPKPRVIPAYLKLENPISFESERSLNGYVNEGHISDEDLLNEAMRADGIEDAEEGGDEVDAWLHKYDTNPAFRAEQNKWILESPPSTFGYEDSSAINDAASELGQEARDRLRKEGYDGVIYKNDVEGGHAAIAFDSDQIQHAIPNAGVAKPQPKPKKTKGAVSAMSLLSGLKKAGSATKSETVEMYHVTPTKNVEAIQKEGLIPKIGERSRSVGEKQKGVYLFKSANDVDDALAGWLGEEFPEDEPLSILKVKVPIGAKSLRGASEYEHIHREPIPPQNISVYRHGE